MLNVKLIGINIKSRRLQLGLSQAQLASGIATQGTISNVEKGTHTPSIELLMGIAQRLKTTLDQLVKPVKEGNNDTAFGIQTLAEIELLWDEKKYSDVLLAVAGAEYAPFFANLYNCAELNFWRSITYYDLRKLDESKTVCDQQISIIRTMGETPLLVSYYNVASCCSMLTGQLAKAKDFLEKAWRILNNRKFPNSEKLYIIVLTNLTNLHLRLEDVSMATHTGNIAAKYARSLVGKSRSAVVYELLAEAFYRQSDFKHVKHYLDFALRIHEIAEDTLGQARILNNMAELARSEGDIKAARAYLVRSSEFISAQPDLPQSRTIESDVKETIQKLLADYENSFTTQPHR